VPKLETLDGSRFFFMLSAVTAVADSDPDTGAHVTTVYGLSAAPLRIADSPMRFLQTIGASDKFVKLTRLDDRSIWINPSAVSVIHSPALDQDPASANCVIPLGDTTHAVKESIDQVRELVNARGGVL